MLTTPITSADRRDAISVARAMSGWDGARRRKAPPRHPRGGAQASLAQGWARRGAGAPSGVGGAGVLSVGILWRADRARAAGGGVPQGGVAAWGVR